MTIIIIAGRRAQRGDDDGLREGHGVHGIMIDGQRINVNISSRIDTEFQ